MVYRKIKLKTSTLALSSGPVVKNLLANARDTGSILGPGRFHMTLGNYACVPQLLKPLHQESVLSNKRSRQNEKASHCNRRGAPTRNKAHGQQ